MELWLSLTREASLILCHGSITEPDISKFQDLVVIIEEHLRKNNLKITQSTINEMQKKKKRNHLRAIFHWWKFIYSYPNTFTVENTIKDLLKEGEECSDIAKVATLINSKVKEIKDEMPWPPQPSSIYQKFQKLHIHVCLGQFLTILISGQGGANKMNNRSAR